jgi:hypothetical protein
MFRESAIKFTSANRVAEADLPKPRIEEGGRVHWLVQRMNTLEDPIRTLYRRMELGDVLLFFYLLALIRQYSWPISNNVVVWILSVSVALSLWCLGLSKKGEPSPREGLSYSFYLIVAFPLFVIYVSRFVFPDVTYDVLTYHISAAERTLRGYPSLIDPPFNPMPDMVTGIYRHILGYRVGTIVNYLALIWVATILVKFLRAFLIRTWLIYLAVLLILLTESLLFEINGYLVDLLALPLLLQATYSVLHIKEPRTIGYSQFYIAFLLGLSVAFKLTNIVFVIPIVLVWAVRVLTGKFRLAPVPLLFLLLVFIAPVIPHAVYLYRETGTFLFPFYNSAQKTTAALADLPAALADLKDKRNGPIGLEQTLLWPVLLYAKAQRLSELGVYAGKIPLGFVLAFFFLPFKRVDNRIRALSFVMILSALLWSLTTGYSRYAFYLELVSSMLIISLFRFVAENLNIRDSLKRVLSISLFGVLGVLSAFSLYYVSSYDWTRGMRPTLLDEPRAYLRECQFLFRDYSLKSFLPPERSALFDDVDVWIRGAPLTSCFVGLMKPDITTIDLGAVEAFDNASNKRMFALCYLTEIKPTVDAISRRGLEIWKITTVAIPFYSYNNVYNLALIEVLPSTAKGLQTGNLLFSSADGPLPASAFQASIASQSIPTSLERGSKATVYFTVKNISTVIWPMLGLTLGNHWLDSNGRVLIHDAYRTGLAFDLRPGDQVDLPLTIETPRAPGHYILEIDMVQEGVAWFSGMGSKTLRVDIRVE